MTLGVIVPSRGRPENINRLCQAWQDTGALAKLVLVTDDDDRSHYDPPPWVHHLTGTHASMAQAVDKAAIIVECAGYDAIGFMGDDHLPRTKNWDVRVQESLDRSHFVYGNDCVQGAQLPTAVFCRASVVKTLGQFCLPGARHLFLDNYWLELGLRTSIEYLPDVIIEHLHPVAGTVEWDDGYRRVNSSEVWKNDEAAFNEWLNVWADIDAGRVLECATLS